MGDLGLRVARAGRPAGPPIPVISTRELTVEDLQQLALTQETQPKSIKKITDRHHALARNLAGGLSEAEAARNSGYSLSRVSVLKGDPAFEELLSFYRAKADEAFENTQEQLAGLAKDAIMELRDRLEDEAEKFTNDDLRRLVETSADRSGNGPSQQVAHTHTVDLSRSIEASRLRALEARKSQARGEIIDAKAIEVAPDNDTNAA